MKKKCTSWLKANCVPVGLVFALSAFFGVRSIMRSSAVEPFANHLREYMDIPGLQRASTRTGESPGSFERGAAHSPRVTGKVVAINKAAGKIDDLHFALPKEFRAAATQEVGAVVWLTWKEKSTGTYTDGAGAYQIACEVTVIDKTRAVIVDERTFDGSRPPSFKKGAGSRTGSKPTEQIVDYLTNLLAGTLSPAGHQGAVGPGEFTTPSRTRERSAVGSIAPRPPGLRPSPVDVIRESSPRPAPPPAPEPTFAAHKAQGTIELTGVIGIPGMTTKALLEITETGFGRTPRKLTVREGDRIESVEVVQIDVARGQVTIRNSGVESVLGLKTPQGGGGGAGSQAAASAGVWPSYSGELNGDLELRVRNPNDFNVRVGLRSGGKGKDFYVMAHGTQSVFVPDGRYVTYFQYSSDPQGIYQGDSVMLFNRGAEITITKVVNGNYGIRKVN